MSLLLDIASTTCIAVALFFFVSGSVGMLRFPDVFTRLHALTKADNAGLGFLVLGLALQKQTVFEVLGLFVVWALVLLASTTAAHLLAGRVLGAGIEPWPGARTARPHQEEP